MKNDSLRPLRNPAKLWSRNEVLNTDIVPRSPGVYAWYFREIPPGIPTFGCIVHDGLTLLYAGIAPRKRSAAGAASGSTLRSRLRQHFRGNASASTLRMTLGCLLGFELRRVGKRLTFGDSETALNEWMQANAFTCWMTCEQPWMIESELIRSVSLPLNLQQNDQHAFSPALRACRAAARRKARQHPLV